MRRNALLWIALAILAIAGSSIAGALIFEALGYAPCELCLKERIPYYVAIPIAALAVLFAANGSRNLRSIAFAALGLIFAGSAVFGAYHAGVEWGFWPGPKECTGSIEHAASVGDFLKQLQTVKVVRCDAAALHIFGLSLAAWNAIISVGLTGFAILGLRIKT
jgi:disulfide bond formation protein DsbB